MTDPKVLATLRLSAGVAARPATAGLSSPGDVAGQFAAMLAGLRDPNASPVAGVSAAVPAASAQKNVSEGETEHRVGGAAVTLLLEGEKTPVAEDSENASSPQRRRRVQAEDVSGRVVETAVAAGQHSDGKWMAMLLSNHLSAIAVAAE